MSRTIVLFLSFFSVQSLFALNFEQLIKRARQMCGDSPYYQSTPRLSDQTIKNYLNEAQAYVSSRWVIIQRSSFTLVAGTTEYSLPDDFQAMKRVQYKNKIISESTLAGLDGDGRAWIDSAGTPRVYFLRTTTASFVGFNPAPTVAATGTIIIDYYVQAAEMVNPTDKPFNGLPRFSVLHETLAKYTAYRFFLSIGNTQTAGVYGSEVIADIKRMEEITTILPNYRPGFSPEIDPARR